MSIKSLLQIILVLLIFLIIGGIYFFYFHSGQKTNFNFSQKKLVNEEKIIDKLNSSNEEILEDIKVNVDLKKQNNEEKKVSISGNNKNQKQNLTVEKNKNKQDTQKENSNLENLTKEIEYITSNNNGDIFKILAKFGKTNLKNNDILDLELVDGNISSLERSTIFITSNYAKYNYTNQNSKFFENVIIKYENKIITCDNFDLNISDNIAVAYNNVIVKDEKSVMKAEVVTMDIVTKDIKINSEEKVRIFTN